MLGEEGGPGIPPFRCDNDVWFSPPRHASATTPQWPSIEGEVPLHSPLVGPGQLQASGGRGQAKY